MVVSEHPKVFEGKRRLTVTDVLDSEEKSDYGSIDNGGADLDEEDDSGLEEAGVRTGVTKSGT